MNRVMPEAAMPVVNLSRLHPPFLSLERAPGPQAAAWVRAFGQHGDEARVLDLARAAEAAAPPHPRPAGLLAELAATSDRRVVAWLAMAGPVLGTSSAPLGLVTLVTSGTAARQRHSIAWLLVHPQARRTGVGRLLVERACHQAWQAAAARVWVECRSDWTDALAFWRAVGFAAGTPASG